MDTYCIKEGYNAKTRNWIGGNNCVAGRSSNASRTGDGCTKRYTPQLGQRGQPLPPCRPITYVEASNVICFPHRSMIYYMKVECLRKEELMAWRRLLALGVLVILICAYVGFSLSAEQSLPNNGDGKTIDLGASAGLLWFPGTQSLSTLGVFMGVDLAPGVGVRISYNHAGISLLGLEIVGLSVLDVEGLLYIAPESKFSLYGFAGGGYILAGVLGEALSGAFLSGGIGLRVTPMASFGIYVQYRAHVKSGVMHLMDAGISIRF